MKTYSPVTIITENENGQLGTEEHGRMTVEGICLRCDELSNEGWEPVEIQVGESQETLPLKWWI